MSPWVDTARPTGQGMTGRAFCYSPLPLFNECIDDNFYGIFYSCNCTTPILFVTDIENFDIDSLYAIKESRKNFAHFYRRK